MKRLIPKQYNGIMFLYKNVLDNKKLVHIKNKTESGCVLRLTTSYKVLIERLTPTVLLKYNDTI